MNTELSLQSYLQQQENKPRLSFVVCGSVDDGKSTLIGRLLFDSKKILADQLTTLKQDSKRHGGPNDLEFAFLVDGLSAEQEQGITIDVAYRFFDSEHKKYMIIDAPGHEQYTRNMITGASQADVAVLLIDARHGLKEQTKRHSYLVSLLGIKHLFILINKMDLVDYAETVYQEICVAGRSFFKDCSFESINYIPIAAAHGVNLIAPSVYLPWYRGLSFLEQLDALSIIPPEPEGFSFAVQNVIRPHQDFRGYSGRVLSGSLIQGQRVKILPSGIISAVKSIHLADRRLPMATVGQSIMLQLEHEVDASRGDVLVDVDSTINTSDQFQVSMLWMDNQPLVAGRHYLLKCATRSVGVFITRIKHQVNIHSLEPVPARVLSLNDIGVCTLQTNQPIVFEPYAKNKELGAFILIDRLNHQTVAAGMIQFSLQRAGTLFPMQGKVTKEQRSLMKNQKSCVYWFTGLSGAGKTTLAYALEHQLMELGHHTIVLDGDNIRQGLCNDLGFTMADRVENIRRVAETAKLMTDAGLIVLVALISPYQQDREFARSLFAEGEFVEVYVKVSLKVAQQRDTKGLYAKAGKGMLPRFTGVDSVYEAPESPELCIDTEVMSLEEGVAELLGWANEN